MRKIWKIFVSLAFLLQSWLIRVCRVYFGKTQRFSKIKTKDFKFYQGETAKQILQMWKISPKCGLNRKKDIEILCNIDIIIHVIVR